MDPTKESAGGAVAEDLLEEAVARVAGGHEFVAVRGENAPPADRERRGFAARVEPELAAEEVGEPEVVVAADEEDREAGLVERREPREGAGGAARDHVTVLEPEVEQVSEEREAREVLSRAIEE